MQTIEQCHKNKISNLCNSLKIWKLMINHMLIESLLNEKLNVNNSHWHFPFKQEKIKTISG